MGKKCSSRQNAPLFYTRNTARSLFEAIIFTKSQKFNKKEVPAFRVQVFHGAPLENLCRRKNMEVLRCMKMDIKRILQFNKRFKKNT
jgi:hypothetical protein